MYFSNAVFTRNYDLQEQNHRTAEALGTTIVSTGVLTMDMLDEYYSVACANSSQPIFNSLLNSVFTAMVSTRL